MKVIQYAIDALSVGSTFALAALGIALLFGLMRLVNFAYAQIIVIGAYAMWFLRTSWDLPWPVVILGLALSVVVTALVQERLAFRPLRNASPPILLASSFAVSVLLQSFLIVAIGDDFRSVAVPQFFTGTIQVGGLHLSRVSLLTLVIGVVSVVGLALFLRKTKVGVQMLAAAEDFDMARMLGVRANRVIASAFAVSGLLAGVLSFIIVAQQGVIDIRMGLPPLLIAFVATVIGGIGSLSGAVVGGLILGILTTVLQVMLPTGLSAFRDAFLYGIVILILVIRPQGILGSQFRERRV